MTSQAPAIAEPLAVPAARVRTRPRRRLTLGRQIVLQALCILIAATVLFPMLWILSMSLDPRNISRPTDLTLIPPGASLDAFAKVMAAPTPNPVTFPQLALNSLFLAVMIGGLSVTVGVLAAYAFSRLRFTGRQVWMIAVLAVLMLPSVATLAPLFVFLNGIKIGTFNLRDSLFGVALAVTSSQLPFAIWNLKGYIDTIPRELEEAAAIDGCSQFRIFLNVILPLSTPVIAVTAFFGFIAGWTEFLFSWTFLTHPENFTLSMALNGMTGQYSGNTPWSQFAAFAILVALPVSVVYLFLQRYIVSGLAIGGVKG